MNTTLAKRPWVTLEDLWKDVRRYFLNSEERILRSFDEVCPHELRETFGTPLFVYSQSILEQQYAALARALHNVPATICYAMKANSNMSVLKVLKRIGSGFDIVSSGELQRLVKIEADMSKVVFSGVGKRDEEITLALQQGVKMLNVESIPELKKIDSVAKREGIVAPVSFRLNPDMTHEVHEHDVTGTRASKFGISPEFMSEFWEIVKKSQWLKLKGVSCHVGSGGADIEVYRNVFKEQLKVAGQFKELGAEISCIDLGGGFAANYGGSYTPIDLAKLGSLIESIAAGNEYEFIVEPGKFLVSEAGILLTEVLYVKNNGIRDIVIVDSGMNDLIRPPLYNAYHEIDLVLTESEKPREGTNFVDVVGPVCEGGCFFARNRELPEIKQGDLLAIKNAGAYCFAMASQYNGRRLPAEVLVHQGNSTLIRKRDSIEDLWRNELI